MKITKNGIDVFYNKDRFGKYYIVDAIPTKRAPTQNIARRTFYAKNKLGKRLDRLQRDNKKYTTLSNLKKFII